MTTLRSSAPAVDLGALISHTPPKVPPLHTSHTHTPHTHTYLTLHTQQPQATASSDPTEKKLLKLRRKMEQITSLKQRVANGESLERTQVM